MAKPKQGNDGGVNKSEAIREAMAQHPEAQTKEVVSLLAEKGIKVQPSLVYLIRSKQRRQKRRQKRERVAATSAKTGSVDPVELVRKVKGLAQDAGGIRNLKKLVDILAE
jgi:hypothetical protein